MADLRDALIPLLTFRWGEETYAVPMAAVREVARPKRITPVPGSSMALVGVTVLHGDVLPVADVRTMLGLEMNQEQSIASPDGCVIVVKTAGGPNEPIGLWVDGLREVVQAPEIGDQGSGIGDQGTADPRPQTPVFLAGRVRGDDGGVIQVLDLAQVLAAL